MINTQTHKHTSIQALLSIYISLALRLLHGTPSSSNAWFLVCLTVSFRRTPFAKIQARLQFPEGYPSTPLIVELTSASLPQPFLRKLTKKAEDAAKAWASKEDVQAGDGHERRVAGDGNVPGARNGKAVGEGGGEDGARTVAALNVVVDTVNKNKFVPCWKEMRQAATLVAAR